jgi:hypothetical protein
MRLAHFVWFVLILVAFSCKIKNDGGEIEIEKGTEIRELTVLEKQILEREEICLGYWVGDFEPDVNEEDGVAEEYLYDTEFQRRTNKINISIDSIVGDKAYGHSVVAGNNRPFIGRVEFETHEGEIFYYSFETKEPGDHKNDGEFKFYIYREEMTMVGTWEAYKKEKIFKRKYELTKKEFHYDSLVKLNESSQFVNWKKSITEEVMDEYDGEMETWMQEKYATSTSKIFSVNGSEKLLKKSDVENLKKGDLEIIRNTIYARHGYSFKNKIYRNFFDMQDWYVPVHADITEDLTDLEKENIKLLLRYEKNAKDYYENFGR